MATPSTGRPRGRPKGAKSRATIERAAAIQAASAAIGEAVPDAFAGDAHALLMAIYKNPLNEIELRLDAAKTAIRYETPMLNAVVVASQGIPAEFADPEATPNEPGPAKPIN